MNTKMKPNPVRAFLLLSTTMFSAGAIAAPQFLPAKAGDLAPQRIVAPETMLKSAGAPDLSREEVAMSWAVDGDIVTAPQTFIGQSREYYTDVSADELAAGVTIHTTSPRALVRIQPLGGGSSPRDWCARTLRTVIPVRWANWSMVSSAAASEVAMAGGRLAP